LGARVWLAGQRDGVARAALGTYLWLPSGDPSRYTGDEGARSMPHFVLDGRVRSFFYAAQLGVTIRRQVQVLDIGVGSELGGGLASGVDVLRERLMAGVEIVGATVVAGSAQGESVDPFSATTTHAEAHLCARLRIGDLVTGVAAGPGLTPGIGTPSIRAVTTVQYAPEGVREAPAAQTNLPPRDQQSFESVQPRMRSATERANAAFAISVF